MTSITGNEPMLSGILPKAGKRPRLGQLVEIREHLVNNPRGGTLNATREELENTHPFHKWDVFVTQQIDNPIMGVYVGYRRIAFTKTVEYHDNLVNYWAGGEDLTDHFVPCHHLYTYGTVWLIAVNERKAPIKCLPSQVEWGGSHD